MEDMSLEHPKLLLFWNARSFPSKQWWCLQSPGLGDALSLPSAQQPTLQQQSQEVPVHSGNWRNSQAESPLCSWSTRDPVLAAYLPRNSFLTCTWGIGSPGEGCRRHWSVWGCVRQVALPYTFFPCPPPLDLTKSCAFSLLATAPAWGRVWWSWTVCPPLKPVFPSYS